MTLRCSSPGCNCAVELVDDNGAEYPETRVEFYKCPHGHKTRKVLTA